MATCTACESRHDTRCVKHSVDCSRHARDEKNYCEHWGETPPADLNLKKWQRELENKKIRLGVCMPTMSMGGITRVLLTMMNAPVGHSIEWSGFAIDSHWTFDLETAKLILKHCPIYASKDHPSYQGLITIVPNAFQTIVDRSDVVNPCGFTEATAEFKAVNWDAVPLLVVAHGQCDWTRTSLAVILGVGSKHILASVSKGGVKCFPESKQDRVGVIYNGVDYTRCAPARSREVVRREWGIKPDTKAIGYIGRFAYGKKPLATAEAVAELGAGYHAVYVGDGNQREKVVNDVLGICSDQVTIVPRTEDIGTVLNAMDCLVSASPSEGGPLSVIEAWLAGCPVVSTCVGIIPELESKHGSLESLIPFDPSPLELAAAVRDAIADRDRVERARSLAWKMFSASRMTLDYEALIRGSYVNQP